MRSATKNQKVEQGAPEHVAKKSFRTKRIVFFGLFGLLLAFGATTAAYAFYTSTRILPHTQISGVDVGGLTKDAAAAKLTDKEQSFLATRLNFTYQGKNWQIPAKDITVQFSNTAALNTAYAYGKTGSVKEQVSNFFTSFIRTRYFDVDVQPLTDSAKDVLSKKVFAAIETQPAETTLSLIPGKVTVVPGKPGQKVDVGQVEEHLYTAFKSGNPDIALQLVTFQPEVSAAQAESARAQADAILASSWKVTGSSTDLNLDPQDIKGWLGTEVARDTSGVATGLNVTLNTGALKDKLTTFASTTDRKAVNARLKQDSGAIVTVQPDKDGLALQVDSTVTKIKDAFLTNPTAPHTVTADVAVAKADLRADTLQALGIKQMIGTATTDFAGSPVNRTFNIQHGQQSLDGGLVKDGETYSTIKSLGPIDESTGYKPELVILGNRTVPQAGGGLCQVSTTLFRAVLNAGLPIVERTNHSYRVGYYERETGPGLDATVYDPEPDFKWKNDTGQAIYIQSSITGTKITFELYGTSDGRVANVPKPTITEEIPVGAPLYSNTDTLFVGEQKQIETAHNGAKTTVTYTVTRNGQEINKQVFNSYYQPWPAQYLVGTKPRP